MLFGEEAAEYRSFDVEINYYSVPHESDRFAGYADFVFGGGMPKLHGAKSFFQETSLHATYESCMFLDDDVELLFDPNRIFLACNEYCHDLAQAALTPGCTGAMGLTRQHPRLKYRTTNFVEVMAPVLRREFLSEMLHSFDMSVSGWGIDVYWGHSLGARWRAGIIDDLLMRHTVPSDHSNGGFYRYLRSIGVDPYAELKAILENIGVNPYFAHSVEHIPHFYQFRA